MCGECVEAAERSAEWPQCNMGWICYPDIKKVCFKEVKETPLQTQHPGLYYRLNTKKEKK